VAPAVGNRSRHGCHYKAKKTTNQHELRKRLPANHPPSLKLRRGRRELHAKIRFGISYLFHSRLIRVIRGQNLLPLISVSIGVHSWSASHLPSVKIGCVWKSSRF